MSHSYLPCERILRIDLWTLCCTNQLSCPDILVSCGWKAHPKQPHKGPGSPPGLPVRGISRAAKRSWSAAGAQRQECDRCEGGALSAAHSMCTVGLLCLIVAAGLGPAGPRLVTAQYSNVYDLIEPYVNPYLGSRPHHDWINSGRFSESLKNAKVMTVMYIFRQIPRRYRRRWSGTSPWTRESFSSLYQ